MRQSPLYTYEGERTVHICDDLGHLSYAIGG